MNPGIRKRRLKQSLAEARLGFNFGQKGVSRELRGKETLETSRLLQRLRSINQQYVAYSAARLSRSKTFRDTVETLFNDLGTTLWPSFDTVTGPFPSWLLRPDEPGSYDEILVKEYPEHLFFENIFHRSRLWKHFFTFVCLKVICFHHNNKDKRPRHFGVDNPPSSDTEDSSGNKNKKDDEVYNHLPSESSSLSSLSSTPEPNDYASMQARVPTAVMAPRQSYTSGTQTSPITTNVDLHSDRPQVAKTKRPAADNSDKATHKRSKHMQEVRLRTVVVHYVLKLTSDRVEDTIHVTPVQHFRLPTGTHGLPIDLTNYARSHWTHDLASGQTWTQNTPLLSRQPRLSYPDVVESPSGPAVENTDLSGRRSLGPDRSRRTALDYGPIGLHEAATNTLMTMIDHTEAMPTTAACPPAGFVKELHVTPTNARQIISELHSTTEPDAETDITGITQPEGAAQTRDDLGPQPVVSAERTIQPPTFPEPETFPEMQIPEENGVQSDVTSTRNAANTTDSPISAAAVPETTTAPDSNTGTVSKLIATSDPSSNPNDALDIELELYIDGKANMNLAEPDAWLMLTDMTNRDELFRLAKDLLEALSHLDAGDEIVAIIFKRPDGEVIPGTTKTSIPITRVGQQDMWRRLVKNMSGAGTWKGELRGYVRVQKAVHGE